MRLLHANKTWLVAMIGALCLVGAAVTLAQRPPALDAQPTAHDVRDLSSVFRHVAHEALPSVVSIQTTVKTEQVVGDFETPLDDENSPFREFFRDNPQLREFFRNAPRQRMPQRRGTGSGFIIDPQGVIVTNTHVVRGAEEVRVELSDGRQFVATDVKTDPRTDVAIIRIDAPEPLQAIPMGDSDLMQIGDWVLAVGSPFGLDMTVTAGIISGKGRGPGINEREDYLQTDAAINPGNSGGPLLNLNGEVIGINTAISSRSGGSDGVAFTIPINMARWVVTQLMESGEVSRAYLGVLIKRIDSQTAESLDTQIGQGVIVEQIMENSPAADSDLQVNDAVLELAGQPVTGPRNLQGIVERLEIGREYTAEVIRDGQRLSVPITMRAMPKQYSLAQPNGITEEGDDEEKESAPSEPQPDASSHANLGIDVQDLTPELANQLGFENTEGVLVTRVKSGSPAGRAGLSAGEVIRRVGQTGVETPQDFQKAMQGASVQDGVLLLVDNGSDTRILFIQSN